MAVSKHGLLKAVRALTRAWPSVASTGTLEQSTSSCRLSNTQSEGALNLFWTRSAVHANACTATVLNHQSPLSAAGPVRLKDSLPSAQFSHQSISTDTIYGASPPVAGCTAVPGSSPYHRCRIRMASNKLSFQNGRHYQTSSSRGTSSSQPTHNSAVDEHTVDEPGAVCWGCKEHLPCGSLVCGSCRKVQPVNSQLNYFQVMGLPQETFDLETAKLDARYKALQWQMHPDLSAHKSASEKEYSAQQSMVVNMAYGVLRTPLSRANYLLTLQGIKAGEHSEGTIQDPELLMEVMDAREEVECTTDAQELMRILNSNRASQRGVLAELSVAFTEQRLSGIISAVTRLTYLVRLEEEVVLKLPSLDGVSVVGSSSSAGSQAHQTGQHQQQ